MIHRLGSAKTTIALSSTEAEYMALTECSKHAQWTISLLQQLLFDVELPIDVFSDSTGAHAIAENNVFHKRTKHISIKFHFADGTLHVNEIASRDNIADIHTKPLLRDQHSQQTRGLGLLNPSNEGECNKKTRDT